MFAKLKPGLKNKKKKNIGETPDFVGESERIYIKLFKWVVRFRELILPFSNFVVNKDQRLVLHISIS